MLGLLPLIDLVAIFIALRAVRPDRDGRESMLAAGTLWGVMVALSTEALGLFHAIDRPTLSWLWLMVFIASVSISFKFRNRLNLKPTWPRMAGALSWAMLGSIAVYLGLTFLVAILAPPNTNDSMQYHMSRVMHWIVNRSVDFYATGSDRQLWMPPFAEYAILHFQILAGNDIFANLVQWMAMAGSVLGVSLIAALLGAKPKGQLFAALFAATLPMGVLQATGTQTDYVAAFWAVCFVYFAVSESMRFFLMAKSPLTLNSALLAFSFGLGVFSKGTFVACAVPFILWIFVALIWKRNWITLVGLAALGLAALLLINMNLWLKNYNTFGNPLGPAVAHLGSTVFTPAAVFSTGLRNAAMQMAFDTGPANKILYLSTLEIHHLLGIDINDPGTTLGTYRIRYSTNEDFAGNPWHFILLSLTLIFLGVVLIKRLYRKRPLKEKTPSSESGEQKSTLVLLFATTVLLSYVVFSALFKWQDTDSRLLLPWFLIAAPVTGWVFDQVHRYLQAGAVILLAVSSLTVLLSNPSRPLIATGQNESIFTAPRMKTRFNNSPEIMNDYISVAVTARDLGCRDIGFGLDSSTPEYLIWAVLSPSGESLNRVENLVALQETERFVSASFQPCAVICNICRPAREMGYDKILDRGSLQLYVPPLQGK